jgi:formate dehydrogenase subunit gamma
MSAVAPWNTRLADELIGAEIAAAHSFYGADGAGAAPLLPILHALQHSFGHVPDAAVPLIAERLNISKAEVRGVISFYHDFETEPAHGPVLKLCRAEACQASGSERVAEHLAATHGLSVGERDGKLRLRNVYCLGNCARGPAAMLNAELIGDFDPAAADALMARLQERTP